MTIPIYFLFMVQTFWIIVFGIVSGILWKNGLKKYIAVGG